MTESKVTIEIVEVPDNAIALSYLRDELAALDSEIVRVAENVASFGREALVALAKAANLLRAIKQLERQERQNANLVVK